MSGFKKAILLINLGTPESPKVGNVRKYLTQFLNDPRVFDINPIARFLLVNFIIVPFRSLKSAKLYSKIWTDKGSPLLFHSQELQQKLQRLVGEDFIVDLAMRYGKPSIPDALERLRKQNLKELIVLPLYPQYSSSTTGSSVEEVFKHLGSWITLPDVKVISSFYRHPAFLNSLYRIAERYNVSEYDHVLFSFHGLPERHLKKGDECNHCLQFADCCSVIGIENHQCYRASCFDTAKNIANHLKLSADKYTVTFQSRLGRDPWIKPYSDEVIIELAKKGAKKLLVFSPAFVADCLETLHEIGFEYNVLFKEHGGEKVQLVESLNSEDFWVEALKEIVLS